MNNKIDIQTIGNWILTVIALIVAIVAIVISLSNTNSDKINLVQSKLDEKITQLDRLKQDFEELKNAKNTQKPVVEELFPIVEKGFEVLSQKYATTPEIFMVNGQISLDKIKEEFVKVPEVAAKAQLGTWTLGTIGNVTQLSFTPNNVNMEAKTFNLQLAGTKFIVKENKLQSNTQLPGANQTPETQSTEKPKPNVQVPNTNPSTNTNTNTTNPLQ